MKTLVLCPLKIELEGFLKTLKEKGFDHKELSGHKSRVVEVPELNLVAIVGGHGKVQMALNTLQFIQKFPDANKVFCIGTSGALLNEVQCLDVVIGKKTVEHDYKSTFTGEGKNRPTFQCSVSTVVPKVLESFDSSDFAVHFGVIASGDEDITGPERANELHELTTALVVAWEGAGAARACQMENVGFCEIRGVSDTAFGESGEDFVNNLPAAMKNSTEVFLKILQEVY